MASVTIEHAERDGDAVTVRGKVDGVAAAVTIWASHLATLATRADRIAYAAARLKEAVVPARVAVDLAATVEVP